VSYDDETEIVEGQRAVLAAIHMEDEGEVAVTLVPGTVKLLVTHGHR
jgi:hypothetical protein